MAGETRRVTAGVAVLGVALLSWIGAGMALIATGAGRVNPPNP